MSAEAQISRYEDVLQSGAPFAQVCRGRTFPKYFEVAGTPSLPSVVDFCGRYTLQKQIGKACSSNFGWVCARRLAEQGYRPPTSPTSSTHSLYRSLLRSLSLRVGCLRGPLQIELKPQPNQFLGRGPSGETFVSKPLESERPRPPDKPGRAGTAPPLQFLVFLE